MKASSAASRRPRWRSERISLSWLLRDGQNPISLGFGPQVYARFSLRDSRTALISNDWVVGVNATARLRALGRRPSSSTTRAATWATSTGIASSSKRLDWSREVAECMGRVQHRALGALHGSVSYAIFDQLGLGPGLRSRGRWTSPVAPGRAVRAAGPSPSPGSTSTADAATAWRVSSSARAGITLLPGTGREIGFALIAHDGSSTQRQFLPRRESLRGAGGCGSTSESAYLRQAVCRHSFIG